MATLKKGRDLDWDDWVSKYATYWFAITNISL